ncbi:hypothetical protein HET73_00595 [Wolbachia endosymbiont of Atemnus politus]|uniref:hypothetical protein n=1 Tax=Wolbachia endosymbiont of Atemnus politus TaxID=2682840 RepID=UPI0015743BD9|nr:hypothetical protein [Wolbachia endosymbiont of Atemnus politus]NSM56196.1 hypothetical protein [Wolbachia endosymbiont of Atemnus politus]NSX83558.1 hypothetical protein [Wolbachia endosymbiont of Atemnus politus]
MEKELQRKKRAKKEGVEPQKPQEQAETSQEGPETPDEKVDLQKSPNEKKNKKVQMEIVVLYRLAQRTVVVETL